MTNNLQLLGMLALLVLASFLAAREVRRVFRSREPKGHAELAAEQLAYAQRQALLHRAQAEEHKSAADMYEEQAERLANYVWANPAPMVVTWKRGDTPADVMREMNPVYHHAFARNMWKSGQRWEFRARGGEKWSLVDPGFEPAWHQGNEYRLVTEGMDPATGYATPLP